MPCGQKTSFRGLKTFTWEDPLLQLRCGWCFWYSWEGPMGKIQSLAGGHVRGPPVKSVRVGESWSWSPFSTTFPSPLEWLVFNDFSRLMAYDLLAPHFIKITSPFLFTTFSIASGKRSQVQQRGIDGTRAIILGLMEGMDCPPEQPLLIVDVLPSRQCWSQIQFVFNVVHPVIVSSWHGPPLVFKCSKYRYV